MASIDIIEFDSEAFTSVYLIQNALKSCSGYPFLNKLIPELKNTVANPSVLVLRNISQRSMADINGILSHSTDLVVKTISKTFGTRKEQQCPTATVVILRASGRHGNCRLSVSDCSLLDDIKKNMKCLEDIIYVIESSRHSLKYDEDDLSSLSEQIQLRVCGFKKPNYLYARIFIFPDKHISIRVGLCLLRSIQRQLCDARKRSQHIINEANVECTVKKNDQNYLTKVLAEKILKTDLKYCSHVSTKKRLAQQRVLTNRIFKLIRMTFHQRTLNPILAMPLPQSKLKKLIRSFLQETKEQIACGFNKEQNKTGNKNIKSSKISHPSSNHSCTMECRMRVSKLAAVKLSELLYQEQSKILLSNLKTHTDDIATFCSCVDDECTNERLHGIYVHEMKTIAYRHEKVVGFGYIDQKICIYIKGDQEEDKKRVFDYIEQYADTSRHNFRIEFRKKREITYFAKLETGSRVNKFQTTGKDSKGYGTLGMFLEDSNGTYFFTTCAHVIDKDANAYLPDDNSKIGKNVFVCHPSSKNGIKRTKRIDLSLIRVCSDNNVECKLGLKGITGKFIKKAVIFHGDISEILGRQLYKWGATEPLLQTGKCIGIEEEEFVYVQIDKENFAKPGDSGAIICVGDNKDTGLAAFVLVGEWNNREDERKAYVVYKVVDALETVAEMEKEMSPCLCTKTITILSASS